MRENVQSDTLRDCQKGELDFVFCERVLYNGTAPEQKTKSAKHAQAVRVFCLFQYLFY